MKENLIAISFAAFAFGNSGSVLAQSIVDCGRNSGYSYYFAGGYVSADKAGWHEDGTSDGQFSLILRGEELDVLFRDATGSLVSAQADGGQIFPLHIGDESESVLVIYPLNVVEVYQFDLVSKSYTLSSTKYGEAPIRKAGTLAGKCR